MAVVALAHDLPVTRCAQTSHARNEFPAPALFISVTLREEVLMKRYILALAAAATLTAGVGTAAYAVEFGIGPGGIYVGPKRHEYREHVYNDDDYNRCRMVIIHRTNRFGEDVEVRKRICD
jgi:hypothetical protein